MAQVHAELELTAACMAQDVLPILSPEKRNMIVL